MSDMKLLALCEFVSSGPYIFTSIWLEEVWTRVTWLGLESDQSNKFDDFRLDRITKVLQLDLYFDSPDSWIWAFWLENTEDLKVQYVIGELSD